VRENGVLAPMMRYVVRASEYWETPNRRLSQGIE